MTTYKLTVEGRSNTTKDHIVVEQRIVRLDAIPEVLSALSLLAQVWDDLTMRLERITE